MTDESYEELNALLSGPEPDWDSEPEAPGNDLAANGRMRALAHLERKLAADQALAHAEIARISDWLEEREAAVTKRTRWLRAALEGWMAAHLDDYGKGPRAKLLPAGKVTVTKQQPSVDIDAEVFLAWASKRRPDLVRRPAPTVPPPAPDALAVRKLVSKLDLERLRPGETVRLTTAVEPDEDGAEPFHVEIPGVTVTVRRPKFIVIPDA